MSLASSPDCLLQPEDRAFKTLFPSLEDSTYAFDEYLNGDSYNHNDQDISEELSDVLTNFLQRKVSNDSRTGFSPSIPPLKDADISTQPWREGLWCMNEHVTAAPTIAIAKTRNNPQVRRTSQKRTLEVPGDDATLYLSSSSDTPSLRTKKKSFVTSTRTATGKPDSYIRQQPVLREATLSPSPMYAQLQHTGGMRQQQSWQQDFQNFHLRRPGDVLVSPPDSSHIPQQELQAMQLNAVIAAQNGTALQHHGGQTTYTVSHQSHMPGNGYTMVDPALLSPSQIGQAISSHGNEAIYDLQYPVPSSHIQPSWTVDSLESSDESQYSHESIQGLNNAQFVQKGHLWSVPAPSMDYIPAPQQCPQQYYYPRVAQATSHPPKHHPIELDPSLYTEGLKIHFPPSFALAPSTQHSTATHPTQAHPPLATPSVYPFTNRDPFSTPRRTRRQSSPLRSPSPCVSPKSISQNIRQRSPTHHNSPTRNRRKSIGNAGPIMHTAAPPVPKTPKTPRTPRTPPSNAVIDFINFTPKDSAKLLSDVAPSGSSKTRARREAEARDNRKRLSEAAMKAVRNGDLRALKAEGLCLS